MKKIIWLPLEELIKLYEVKLTKEQIEKLIKCKTNEFNQK